MSETASQTASQKDIEKGNDVTVNEFDNSSPQSAEETVHRNLKARHLQMIALGGAIGTGLFVGSGSAYATGGPLGILLGYSIMGAVVYTMMVALGEMAVLFPVSGAFVHYAGRFVDPALGFALGWNYWYSYAITLPTEVTAAALVIDYWPHGASVNPAVWITIFLIVICSFNFLGVRYYGEAEFWFCLIKIITIVGLLITALVITCGGGPNHDAIGFRYWRNPGPFQQLHGIPGAKGRFLAFWTVFVQAAFSFLGTEIVALTAAEAQNPRRNLPKAIRRVFYRLLVFYVIGVFMIGLTVDPNDERLGTTDDGRASPWVIAIQSAGIKVLPSIINSVILISAFSAGNSDLYASSRTLYGLALDGKAPAFFRYCTKGGLPVPALIATALVGVLAYMNVSNSAGKVFGWLSNLSSITGLIAWGSILLAYIRYRQGLAYQGIDRTDFAYKAPFQPYASYFGLVFIILVIFFNGYTVFLSDSWDTADFIVAYVTVVIFLVLFVFWKFWKRTSFVSVAAMDFDTGRRELEAAMEEQEAAYTAPTTFIGKLWDWIM